jgi:cysteinyl-tRNA synthetase
MPWFLLLILSVCAAGLAQQPKNWVYQLTDYPEGKLDALAAAPFDLAVIDLARDAHLGYFTPSEIAALRKNKKVLAYFEIGSIENFRPEWPVIKDQNPDLLLNQWPDWPEEYFVRYWEERWWQRVVRPRVQQALDAGFDGIYMDTPLAYEELELALVPGETRDSLARKMVALIVRISQFAKAQRPGFWVFPQNSPELRRYPGYTAAIDGIGMEELFFLTHDKPCTKDYCAENLAETRALHQAGKIVLAVDYAKRSANIAKACQAARSEGFVPYVTKVELDRITPPCP